MKLGPYQVPGFYQGNAVDMIKALPDESIQCVITSPPYWGLRVYPGEQAVAWADGERCPFGNEQTPEAYVAHTVEVLAAIHRVLRKDGVVYWNVGDSYYNNAANHQDNVGQGQRYCKDSPGRHNKAVPHPSMKQKDLCLIPHRVALAAQAAGWYVRSDIIWSKPNPMPESVTDRPTSSHEHILMLTKAARYYWDADAVREQSDRPELCGSAKRNIVGKSGHKRNDKGIMRNDIDRFGVEYCNPLGRNIRNVWTIPTRPYSGAHFAVFPPKIPETCIKAASKPGDVILDPFCGSGTTCAVAENLGRLWIGFDISAEYSELQKERTAQVSMVRDLLTAEAE